MKTAKRALSALMVLAMLMSCMGATPLETEEEQQPTVTAEVIEVSPSADEPQESEPAGETEPAGEPQTSEPADEPQESEPAGETEPADEPQESEPAGENEAEPKAMAMSLGEPSPIDLPAPVAEGDTVKGTVTWTGLDNLTYGSPISNVSVKTDSRDYDPQDGKITTYEGVGETKYGPVATAPTNAGTYKVTAEWMTSAGEKASATQEFTIKPKEVTITLAASVEKPYTGQNIVLTQADVQSTDWLVSGDTIESITTSAVKADTYSQGLTIELTTKTGGTGEPVTGNYKVTSVTGTLKVTKLDLTNAKPVPEKLTVVYNGTAQTPDLATVTVDNVTLAEGTDYTVEQTQSATNVGDKGTITLKATDNGNAEGNATVNFDVEPLVLADNMVTLTGGDTVYTGSTLTVPTVTVTYNGKTIASTNYTVAPLTDSVNAGEKEVTVNANATVGNCTGSATAKYTVASKSLTGATVTLDKASFPYSGQNQTPNVTVELDGVKLTADDFEVVYKGNMKDVGTVTVTVTGKGNYTGTATETPTYEITPKEITLTAEDATVVYGEPIVLTAKTDDMVSGESLNDLIKYTLTVDDKPLTDRYDVGEHRIDIDATDLVNVVKGNYEVKHVVHGTLTITARPITVTGTATAKEYTGEELTGVFKATAPTDPKTPLADGDTMTLTATLQGTNVGSYHASWGEDGVVLEVLDEQSHDVTKNYAPTVEVDWQITQAAAETYKGTVELDSWVYDGTAHAPTAAIDPATASETIIKEYGAPTYHYYAADGEGAQGDEVKAPPVDVGTYFVKAIWNEDGADKNLPKVESKAVKYEIKVRPITVTAAQKAVFTGEDITVSLTEKDITAKGDLAEGDDILSLKASVTGRNVGDHTTNIATIVIQNAAKADVTDNYEITFTGTLTIEKEDAGAYTPSVTMNGWTYGDTANEPKATVTGPGSESYAAPTITYAVKGSSDFASAQPVNAGDYTVKAAWAATDDLPALEATAAFTISKRPITVHAAQTAVFTDADITAKFAVSDITDSASIDMAPDEEIVSLTATVTGKSVGTYTTEEATIVIVNAENVVTANYDITFTGTLTIVKAEASAYTRSVSLESWTYGDTANEPKATVTGPGSESYAAPTITYAAKDSSDFAAAKPVNAGDYTVKAAWAATNDLPALEATAAFTIDKRSVTLTSADGEKIYDGTPLTAETVTIGDELFAEGEGVEFSDFASVTDVAEGDVENTFTYTATDGTDLEGNYVITVVNGTLKITPKAVTVTAAGTKQFGAADPARTLLVNEPADPTGNALQVAFAGVVEGEEDLFLKQTAFQVAAARVEGEEKELPGLYDITVTVTPVEGNTDAQNYDVKVATYEDAYEITDVPAFNVVLGDADSETDITTHTIGQVGYTIRANDDQTPLVDDLQNYVDVTLHVDPAQTDPNVTVTSNIPEDIPQDKPVAENAKKGTFTIPAVNYSYAAPDQADAAMTWKSGLPVGTELNVVIVSGQGSAAVVARTESKANEETVVAAVVTAMTIDTAPGAGMNKYVADGDPMNRVILDRNATVTVLPASEDAANVGEDDWIVLSVGGNTYYYSASDVSRLPVVPTINGLAMTLNYEQIMTLAGASGEEGAWFGGNPGEKLFISAKLVDGINHAPAEAGELYAAFDTAGVNSTQDVGNREEAESIAMRITDTVSAVETVATVTAGTYGGSTPVLSATSGQAGTVTWTNVTEWKNTPETLPHSGSSFTVQYKDLVGNPVTHTVNVVRSTAVTPNTIYVQPITDNTVPGKALTFFGDTNVWEEGVLTVGTRSYSIEPLAGSEVYDNTTKKWQHIVTLGDIDFPIGVPTTVTMSYEDLNGGEASIRITYKDQAQTPVLSSEPVAGSQTLWGYVESSASVSVSVYHADGSITQVPQDSIAVDQFGYFYVRLGSPLAEGEQITISTRDFCDNQKIITANVQKELEPDAVAEVLGANIVDELEDTDDIYHRFATPIDLHALEQAEGKAMTLPILAYKSIEIGQITFTLDDQGKLNATYNIKATSFVPDEAQVKMATFTSKPTIDELVLGEMPVVVDDLKANPTGTIPAIDVTANQADDGSYSGVIWLQMAFDIHMTEDNYISRGGRDARFYRWLTESLQTESVLGAVYKETSAYSDNVLYYNQYQAFENISRMN